jgi:dTDP-4-dehydrorhamnose reductase
MRVLVLGATGMLGHMVYLYLKEHSKDQLFNSVYRTKLTENSILCDVRDLSGLQELFEQTRPDVVINCVGGLVQKSQQCPEYNY